MLRTEVSNIDNFKICGLQIPKFPRQPLKSISVKIPKVVYLWFRTSFFKKKSLKTDTHGVNWPKVLSLPDPMMTLWCSLDVSSCDPVCILIAYTWQFSSFSPRWIQYITVGSVCDYYEELQVVYGHAELSRSGILGFPWSSNCKITKGHQEKLFGGILTIAGKAGFDWLLKRIGQLSATISKNLRYETPNMVSGTSQKCTVQEQIVHSPEFGRAIPLIPCQPLR